MQLGAPTPHHDSASSASGDDSSSTSAEEVRQWDWHGSKRYGLAPPSIASLEDVSAWCEAGAAVLRALPLVAQAAALAAEHGVQPASRRLLRPLVAGAEQRAAQHGSAESDPAVQLGATPAQLAQLCVRLAVAAACCAVHVVGRMPLVSYASEIALAARAGRSLPAGAGSSQRPEAAGLEAAQRAVWSIHTAAARLAHWAWQPGSGGCSLAGGTAGAAGVHASWRSLPLLRLLNSSLGAARLLQSQLKGQSAADPDLQYDRCGQGSGSVGMPPAVLLRLFCSE